MLSGLKHQVKPLVVTTAVVVICFFSSYKKDQLRSFLDGNPMSIFTGDDVSQEESSRAEATEESGQEEPGQVEAPPPNPFNILQRAQQGGGAIGQRPPNPFLRRPPPGQIPNPRARNQGTAAPRGSTFQRPPPGNNPYGALLDIARQREQARGNNTGQRNPFSPGSIGSAPPPQNKYFEQLSERLKKLQGGEPGEEAPTGAALAPLAGEAPVLPESDLPADPEQPLPPPDLAEILENERFARPERDLTDAEAAFIEQIEELEDALADEGLLE